MWGPPFPGENGMVVVCFAQHLHFCLYLCTAHHCTVSRRTQREDKQQKGGLRARADRTRVQDRSEAGRTGKACKRMWVWRSAANTIDVMKLILKMKDEGAYCSVTMMDRCDAGPTTGNAFELLSWPMHRGGYEEEWFDLLTCGNPRLRDREGVNASPS